MAFECQQCDKPERECLCDRFCILCQSQHDVRLCQDGYYYCADCRQACHYYTEDDLRPA